MNEQMTHCCGQCPFARTTSKEYLDTKGQNGERFAGQSIGVFILPCHMREGFDEWRSNPYGVPLCAGAAKFRANLGVDSYLPEAIGRLPEDDAKVFGNVAELLAHHEGTSIEEAESKLLRKPVIEMLRQEMAKQGVQVCFKTDL